MHTSSSRSRIAELVDSASPPSKWGLPDDGPHTTLWAGHTGDPHADTPDAGLLEISADAALEAVDHRLRMHTDPAPIR